MPRAGLDAGTVTAAAATLADEEGLAGLAMNAVAARLGVKTPSLYKHVEGIADLTRRIAILAADELGDELRDALQGRSGRDALGAAAQTVRSYVRRHPGRYDATVGIRPDGPHDPLAIALDRTLGSFAAALHGYTLDPADEVHALRMLRSVLHGFATIEASGGFQMATDVDPSLTWIVGFLDHGFLSIENKAVR
ncbi:TetR-like C-terminal domain-containing protein [Curtobacterium sp. USHLN213]|uniref:TetR-like C-terminal domain-containing protein n=1 Tax=Curtobacterium sp. USHLN213 TaxID=3081255 RepID=UPI00301ABA3A